MGLAFNTRWGDPETEAIVLRLETSMLDLINASIDGTAAALQIKLRPGAAACVIAASAGYPAAPRKGDTVHGLDAPLPQNTTLFHAGTAQCDGQVVTAGGRVLAVSAAAPTLQQALHHCYSALDHVAFDGMQFRNDIGARALR